MARPIEKDFVQSFDPGMPGEPASWVHVETVEAEDAEPRIAAYVAYAPISANGALYTEAPRWSWGVQTFGFRQGVEVATRLNTTDRSIEMPVLHGPGATVYTAEPEQFGQHLRKYFPELSFARSGIWALGQAAILDNLRDQLTVHDAYELYEPMYYAMAQVAGEHDQLADAGQIDMTLEELHEAEVRQQELSELLKHDIATASLLASRNFRGRLEQVEAYNANRLHHEQVESRLQLAKLASPLAVGGIIQGAGCLDEIQGTQHPALPSEVQGHVPAHTEMEHEIKELRLRNLNAADIVGRLATLHAAETAIVNR